MRTVHKVYRKRVIGLPFSANFLVSLRLRVQTNRQNDVMYIMALCRNAEHMVVLAYVRTERLFQRIPMKYA